jgi:hypothetical protein
MRVHPFPLYKGGNQQERCTTNPTTPPPQPPPTTSLVRRPYPGLPPPTSISLPRGLSNGCVGDRNHHRDTPSCCRISGSLFQSFYFRISAENGVPGVIVVSIRVRVCGGAAHAVRSRCAKIFTTLRSATSSSIATLVRECNPHISVFEGTCPKLLSLQHY